MSDDLREVIINVTGNTRIDPATVTLAEAVYSHALGAGVVADEMLQRAFDQGYDEGYTDGYDTGFEDGTTEQYRGPDLGTWRIDV